MSRARMAEREYGAFEDDYRGYDVREDETMRGPMILALAVGVLIIFGGVVWNTYRQGVRPAGEGLPPVLADESPYKRAADQPPAVSRSVSDLRIYNNWEPDAASGGSDSLAGEPDALEGGELAPASDYAAPPEAGPGDPDAAAAGEVASGPPAQMSGVEPSAVSRAAPPSPLRPLGGAERFGFAAQGPFLVQLAALQSEEAAEKAWRRISSGEPELYYGANKFIQRADLGAQGVFYRLRVGAFTDRSDAVAFCEAVKQAGTNCIVVTG